MYDKLPEVIKRREDEKRRAQYQKNRIVMRQFDKVRRLFLVVLNSSLQNKPKRNLLVSQNISDRSKH